MQQTDDKYRLYIFDKEKYAYIGIIAESIGIPKERIFRSPEASSLIDPHDAHGRENIVRYIQRVHDPKIYLISDEHNFLQLLEYINALITGGLSQNAQFYLALNSPNIETREARFGTQATARLTAEALAKVKHISRNFTTNKEAAIRELSKSNQVYTAKESEEEVKQIRGLEELAYFIAGILGITYLPIDGLSNLVFERRRSA